MMKHIALAAAALAVGTTSAQAATNLLTNGGFEAGNFSGWSLSLNEGPVDPNGHDTAPIVFAYNQASPYPTGVFGVSVPPSPFTGNNPELAGTYGAYFSSDSAVAETISQTVTGLVAGHSYAFGFDYYLPYQSNPFNAHLVAAFDGVTFGNFTASTQAGNTWFTDGSTYTATDSVGTFSFTFSSDGYYAKDYVIDRVYLIDVTQLPEPASWAMMVAGFGLTGAALRRKRTPVAFA